jgi:predicted ATPase with chaperone activity
MLTRRLTTILPAVTLAEAIETTRIHHVAGLTGGRTAFVTTRAFRAPHHIISDAGLVGGPRAEAGRGVTDAPQQLHELIRRTASSCTRDSCV